MKAWGTITVALLMLAALAAIAFAGFHLIRFAIQPVTELSEPVRTVTMAVLLVVVLLTIVITLTVRRGQDRHRVERLRAERAEAYRRFVEVWALSMGSDEACEGRRANEEAVADVRRDLLLVGSRGVIRQYAAFCRAADHLDADNPAVCAAIERVLVEIRRDLGRSSVLLNNGELIDLFLQSRMPGAETKTDVVRPRDERAPREQRSHRDSVVVLTD